MASGSTGRVETRSDARLAAMRGETTQLDLRGRLRLAIRALGLLGLLIALLPLHYLFRILAYGSPFPMYFLRGAARLSGARVEIIGTPLRRDVFFISNHISWLDILALAGASGTAFVAKYELSQVPVISWLCALNRTVFVQRENRLGVAQQIEALREALADNWSVTVFPEGTTTDGHSLLPFKSSILSVLEPPPKGVLVQPVMLDYGRLGEEIGWIGDESGLNNARRILSRRGSFPVRIHFLEPFSPEDYPGRKAIAAKARGEIEQALLAALDHPLRDFAHTVAPVRYVAPADRDALPPG